MKMFFAARPSLHNKLLSNHSFKELTKDRAINQINQILFHIYPRGRAAGASCSSSSSEGHRRWHESFQGHHPGS